MARVVGRDLQTCVHWPKLAVLLSRAPRDQPSKVREGSGGFLPDRQTFIGFAWFSSSECHKTDKRVGGFFLNVS